MRRNQFARGLPPGRGWLSPYFQDLLNDSGHRLIAAQRASIISRVVSHKYLAVTRSRVTPRPPQPFPPFPFGYALFVSLVAREWSARSRGTGINQCSVRKLIQLAILYHNRQGGFRAKPYRCVEEQKKSARSCSRRRLVKTTFAQTLAHNVRYSLFLPVDEMQNFAIKDIRAFLRYCMVALFFTCKKYFV